MKLKFAATTVLAFALQLSIGGCHSPAGGTMPHSGGTMTYVSTETRQTSITVVDLRTDEELFVMYIPPGKQLTMDFRAKAGDDPVHTPDIMRWELFDAGRRTGRLKNSLTVPNAASRRIDVEIHQGIEWADAPQEEVLRTDELADRPDWWTPRGGELPGDTPAGMYDG